MVFVTDSENVSVFKLSFALIPIDLFPNPLEVSLVVKIEKYVMHLTTSNKFLNYNKANFETINNFVALIDWDLMHITCSNIIDNYVSSFYDKILLAIELYVPISISKTKNHPPWQDNFIY